MRRAIPLLLLLAACPPGSEGGTGGGAGGTGGGAAGGAAGGATGGSGGGCTAETDGELCAAAGVSCGALTGTDRCGAARTTTCGVCASTASCVQGRCQCNAETNASLCQRNNTACGQITDVDNCGASRTVNCGGCSSPNQCVSGQCRCIPESDPQFCARQSKSCGVANGNDFCGTPRTVANCGACSGVTQCSAGRCSCPAETDFMFCLRLDAGCGYLTDKDTCNNTRNAYCGGCTGVGETCAGGGVPNQCGCTVKTDAQLCTAAGKSCGSVMLTDNCGGMRTASCGTCTGYNICTASNTCVPLTYQATWSRALKGDGGVTAEALAVDQAGNAYATGTYQEPQDFGGNAGDPGGVFFVSYDAAGNRRWARRLDNGLAGHAAAVNNPRHTVCFTGDMDRAAFVRCFDFTGTPSWAFDARQSDGGVGSAKGYGITSDVAGDWYVTGRVSGQVDFGPQPLVASGRTHVFLSRLDPSGAPRWVNTFTSTGTTSGPNQGRGVGVQGGTVAITGVTSGASIDFGGGPVTGNDGTYAVFIAAFDTDGGHRWSRRTAAATKTWYDFPYYDDPIAEGRAIFVDPAGEVSAFGNLITPVDLGGGTIGAGLGSSVFAARYSGSGGHRWSKAFFTACGVSICHNTLVYGATVDGWGNSVLTGYLDSPQTFGGPASVNGGYVVGLAADSGYRFSYQVNGAVAVGAGDGGILYVLQQTGFNDAYLTKLSP